MNPGLAEEGGKVASGIVDALKAQPAVLALTVANIGMMVFIFYALTSAATFRDTMLRQSFEYQKEVALLLAKCVVPDKTLLRGGGHGVLGGSDANSHLLRSR